MTKEFADYQLEHQSHLCSKDNLSLESRLDGLRRLREQSQKIVDRIAHDLATEPANDEFRQQHIEIQRMMFEILVDLVDSNIRLCDSAEMRQTKLENSELALRFAKVHVSAFLLGALTSTCVGLPHLFFNLEQMISRATARRDGATKSKIKRCTKPQARVARVKELMAGGLLKTAAVEQTALEFDVQIRTVFDNLQKSTEKC